MIEVWKDIEGFEGLYQISNKGNVKSLNKRKGRILKPATNGKGYLTVALCKEGKQKSYIVHRLVAQAFIDNSNNLPEVNHKDEDKTNNTIQNLEWCNHKYNSNYGTRNDKISKKVLCVETGKIYASTNQVERELGFDFSNISKCCRGKLKQAYGFHWKYVS